jgi:plasmid stability protein
MGSITIANLDEGLQDRLRRQAADHGRSVEDEARDILQAALATKPARPADLAASIRARFAPLGGVQLPIPPREAVREQTTFDE